MATKKINRNDERSADLAALLTLFVTALDEPTPRMEIEKYLQPELTEMGIPDQAVTHMLRRMAARGEVNFHKAGGAVLYWGKSPDKLGRVIRMVSKNKKIKPGRLKRIAKGAEQRKAAAAANLMSGIFRASSKASKKDADLVIDLVKETGRARITVGELVIEIGVVSAKTR